MKKNSKVNRNASLYSKVLTTVSTFFVCLWMVKLDVSLLHKISVAGGSVVFFRLAFFIIMKKVFSSNHTFNEEEFGEAFAEEEVERTPIRHFAINTIPVLEDSNV